jgi:hypothetical protein
MEGSRATRISNLVTVRCLGCSELYTKPLGGGTVRSNPGCPQCGYVGWVLAPELAREAAAPHHSYGDHPRRRSA